MRIIELEKHTLDIEGYLVKPGIPHIIENQSVCWYAEHCNGEMSVQDYEKWAQDNKVNENINP